MPPGGIKADNRPPRRRPTQKVALFVTVVYHLDAADPVERSARVKVYRASSGPQKKLIRSRTSEAPPGAARGARLKFTVEAHADYEVVVEHEHLAWGRGAVRVGGQWAFLDVDLHRMELATQDQVMHMGTMPHMAPIAGRYQPGASVTAERGALLGRVAGVGIRWFRVNVYWRGQPPTEPRTRQEVEGVVRFVHEVHLWNAQFPARAFRVCLTFTGAPGVPSAVKNPSPDAFGQFIREVLLGFDRAHEVLGDRGPDAPPLAPGWWKPIVRRFSSWNEPNLASRKGDADTSTWMADANGSSKGVPRVYARIHRRARQCFLAVHPDAQVLLGELAGGPRLERDWIVRKKGEKAKASPGFLALLAKAGPLEADGLAIHPYDFSTKKKGPSFGSIRRLADVREALGRYARRLRTPDRRALPLFLTEYGCLRKEFGAHPNGERTVYCDLQEVTLQLTQRARLRDAVTRQKEVTRALELARREGARQLLFYELLPEDWPSHRRKWDSSIFNVGADGAIVDTGVVDAIRSFAVRHQYPL